MLKWAVGDVHVMQVVETEAALPLTMLLPGADPAELNSRSWIRPFLDKRGNARLSINSLLVQTSELSVVVDCCAGNDKPRGFPGFDRQSTPFLEHLGDVGFGRDDVDVVVCTHLHVDHVGWNTLLEDGRWVPTFPSARYLMGRDELDYWRTQEDSPDERTAFEDSVQPVLDAGLVDLVEPGHEICEQLSLVSTPGHTRGHMSVRISSGGEEALITGDMVHHPAQIAFPEWSCFLDYDGRQSAAVRRRVFADMSAGSTLMIGTHFVEPTAGRIVADGDAYRFDT
jgi:glyoxylase-like metal-dependent hydrolase (beta-lactamase superfamily II)